MSDRRWANVLFVLVCLFIFMRHALAASWQQEVSSKFSAELDSNPTMSSTYPGGVWRAFIEPNYTLTGKTGESEIKTGIGLQIARSTNKALSQNLDGPTVFFDWLGQSIAGEIGVSSKYAEIATRDAGLDANSIVPIGSTRASRILSGRWSNSLSARSTLSANGAYERISYKGGTYFDFASQSADIKYSYVLSETRTPFLKLSGNKYEPTGGRASTQMTSATLGMNWKDEFVDVTLQAGESHEEGNADFIGSAELLFNGQKSQLTLKADRQVLPSGLGGFVKADQVMGGFSLLLSENTSAGVDLQWRKNLTVPFNYINSSSEIWMRHNLTPIWWMRTYCQHKIATGVASSASSNAIGFSFVYDNIDF